LIILEAMNDAGAINVNSFDRKREKIINMAAKLKENTYSDGHADVAKKAFIETANLIPNSEKLAAIARKIDVDVLMTKQANIIYDFFDQANEQLQSMSKNYVMEKNNDVMQSESERK